MSRRAEAKRVNAARACVADGECRPKHASHKSTARWCRGHVGVEHAWETTKHGIHPRDLQPGELGFVSLSTQCTACGKKRWSWGERECHCGARMEPVVEAGARRRWCAAWCQACGYRPSCDLPLERVRQPGGVLTWERATRRVPCRCEKERRREAFAAAIGARSAIRRA